MNIEDMSKSDLIEYVEELHQIAEDAEGEMQGREEIGYDRAMLEMKKKIELAFYAGHNSGVNNDSPLKALLNYNMEQRL